MEKLEKLDYVEFASKDLPASKAFFTKVFAWTFTDYGEEYTAFAKDTAGLDGGFYAAGQASASAQGAPLLVFYSAELEATQARVLAGGGELSKAIFSFPGGRRFQFIEPGGNELSVWSDK